MYKKYNYFLVMFYLSGKILLYL